MDVVSACPLRVASLIWRPGRGGFALTVACRATYLLEPIRSVLADVQEEPSEEDNHWDDDETRSLSAPSDLVPFKKGADVLLVGHAFAPRAEPVRSVVARLQVGGVDKAVEAHCDRAFTLDGGLVEGPRIASMSLRWERAAGGPGTSNPVGMRFDAAPDRFGRVPVPNLQPPWKHVAARGDIFDPVGFGPIAPSWPTRADKLHRHAAGWPHRRWFARPLAEDIGRAYFNAAPPDQQVDALAPDARIVLENLHREHPRLVTSLAPVIPRAIVERSGRGREEIALACDTLWIDTDRGICTLVWRGTVALAHPEEAGRVVVWTEADARAIAAPDAPDASIDVSLDDADDDAGFVAVTTQPSFRIPDLADPLPFRKAPVAPEAGAMSPRLGGGISLRAAGGGTSLRLTQTLETQPAEEAAPRAAGPALPFRRARTVTFTEAESTGLVRPDELVRRAPTLPFGAPGEEHTAPLIDVAALRRAAAPAPQHEPQPAPPSEERTGLLDLDALERRRASRTPASPPDERTGLLDLEALEKQRAALPFVASTDVEEVDDETHTDAPTPAGDPFRRTDTVPPPGTMIAGPAAPLPFLGALAHAARPLAEASIPAPIDLARLGWSAAEPLASPAREPPRARVPEAAAEPADPFTVQLYAKVKVAFWSRGGDPHAAVEDTLRELGLDEDAFRAGEELLLAALADEAAEGGTSLARALRAEMTREVRAVKAARPAAGDRSPARRRAGS